MAISPFFGFQVALTVWWHFFDLGEKPIETERIVYNQGRNHLRLGVGGNIIGAAANRARNGACFPRFGDFGVALRALFGREAFETHEKRPRVELAVFAAVHAPDGDSLYCCQLFSFQFLEFLLKHEHPDRYFLQFAGFGHCLVLLVKLLGKI